MSTNHSTNFLQLSTSKEVLSNTTGSSLLTYHQIKHYVLKMRYSVIIPILLSIATIEAHMTIWCNSNGIVDSYDGLQMTEFKSVADFFAHNASQSLDWFDGIISDSGVGHVFMSGSNYDDPRSCWNALKDHVSDQVNAQSQTATCTAKVDNTIARCWMGYTIPE